MNRRALASLLMFFGGHQVACVAPAADLGELGDSSGSTGEDSATSVDANPTGMTGADGSTGEVGSACGPDGPSCAEDLDLDCVGIDEDNAPGVYNPEQSDIDGDLVADEEDLCPSVPAGPGGPLADADSDGVGSECDPCRRAAQDYANAEANPPGYMAPRNIPSVADSDGDGIGDACDNCIHVPNCESYGDKNPWRPGDPIADGDGSLCQIDNNENMVGDACEGMQAPGAAGPVGLGPDDDFDQDGLTNIIDGCPRLVLSEVIECEVEADCGPGRHCETTVGICDHPDMDTDGVGDACDSCPLSENPNQIVGDVGPDVVDDDDGDFVGNVCEATAECATRPNPTRTGFFPVAVDGWCCTTQFPTDVTLLDPDGRPIEQDCEDEVSCRQLPLAASLNYGLVQLPNGCDAALAEAGLSVETHLPLTADDVGGVDALWDHSCRLPPLDQDFDGLPDVCDLCPFAFDPDNAPYIDDGGVLRPDLGAYCNGAYAFPMQCA